MYGMFRYCYNLEVVNFGNIDTSSVEDMSYLFSECSKIVSIDLSNFDFSKVRWMDSMFDSCSNLENIRFGNSVTSSVETLYRIFFGCQNLTSIDLSNFDTSKVQDMSDMFQGCSSLEYLNLSHFTTPNILNINSMFSGCTSLKYLNLYSFQIESHVYHENIFEGLSPNVTYCINDNSTKNLLLPQLGKILFCPDECMIRNNSKIDISNQKCVDSCMNTTSNIYEYNNICYNICPRNTLNIDYLCIDIDCDKFEQYSIKCLNNEPLGYYFDPINEI